MPGKMELLSGPTVEQTLKDGDVTVFRYILNKPGLYMVLGVAFFFYALAGLTWWETQLSEPVWTVAFVCLLFVGMGFSAVAAYWHQFANQNVIGVSDDRLFVGGPKKLWAVSWDLLDRQAMGFEEMELSRLRGGLNVNVGGQRIKVHLFNAIAYLNDIEGFMFGVLNNIQLDDDEADNSETD